MSDFKSHQSRLNTLIKPILQRNFHSDAATDELISKAHRTEKPKNYNANDFGAVLKKTGGGLSRMR